MTLSSHYILGASEREVIAVRDHNGRYTDPSTGGAVAEIRTAYVNSDTTMEFQVWHGPDDHFTKVIIDRQQAIKIAQALINWATDVA